MTKGSKALTLAEVGEWMGEAEVSVHLRLDGGKFVVVAHSRVRDKKNELAFSRAADATSKDLEHAMKTVMADY